jgi:hypothetical protein
MQTLSSTENSVHVTDQMSVEDSGPMCAKCDLAYAQEQELGLRPFSDTNPGK